MATSGATGSRNETRTGGRNFGSERCAVALKNTAKIPEARDARSVLHDQQRGMNTNGSQRSAADALAVAASAGRLAAAGQCGGGGSVGRRRHGHGEDERPEANCRSAYRTGRVRQKDQEMLQDLIRAA